MAYESNRGNPGNGMRVMQSDRSRGADPPKKEFGMTGIVSSSDIRSRRVSAGNGSCIVPKAFSHSKLEICLNTISHTRSLCPSAATMLSTQHVGGPYYPMTMGKSGQTCSFSLTGFLAVQ